jgi:hypothetical protein
MNVPVIDFREDAVSVSPGPRGPGRRAAMGRAGPIATTQARDRERPRGGAEVAHWPVMSRITHALFALSLAPLAVACAEVPESTPASAAAMPLPLPPLPPLPPIHVITANADGTFSPMWTNVNDGDIVRWNLSDRTDAIVPVTWSGNWPAPCSTPKPWTTTDPNNFSGPMLAATAGVYALSPVAAGLVSQAGACPAGTEVGHETDYLCRTGPAGQTMTSTWADPEIDGVFLRLLWNQLEPADCTSTDLTTCWNWSVIDREIAAAVAHGKRYSISVKAGDDGTPDWLFTTDPPVAPFVDPIGAARPLPNGGVTRLFLQDSGNDAPGCGATMYLGDPTEPAYQDQYFDMLTALAAHIESRSDWYRALVAVKPSGANLQSHENRLPKRCDTSAGCVCNTERLAANGYTPQGLYDFYTQQVSLLSDLFPGKAISYALIQQGFPRVTSATIYQIDEDALGNVQSSNGVVADLPLPAEQTETILANGAAQAALEGFVWTVSHNGLGPNLAPNPYVLAAASADTATTTGFQTNNASGVPDAVALDATFENLELNAPEATYLEIYEERQWEAQQIGGVLDPAGSALTLGDWGNLLRDRQRAEFPALRDPEPTAHAWQMHYTIASGSQIIHYVNPAKCALPGFRYGAISINP